MKRYRELLAEWRLARATHYEDMREYLEDVFKHEFGYEIQRVS